MRLGLWSFVLSPTNPQGSNGQLGFSIASIEAIQTLDGVRVEIVEPFFTVDPGSGVIAINTSLEREAEMEGFHYYEITVSPLPLCS